MPREEEQPVDIPNIAILPRENDDDRCKWTLLDIIKIIILIIVACLMYSHLHIYMKAVIEAAMDRAEIERVVEEINEKVNRFFEMDYNMTRTLKHYHSMLDKRAY